MRAIWQDLDIPDADFDVAALGAAIEAQRQARDLSWTQVAREVNRAPDRLPPRSISASTLRGLADKRWGVEGDGVLQMLLWLDAAPERFVPGHPGAGRPEARLPIPANGQVLRFDTRAIHAALDAQRGARDLSWRETADEVGGLMNTAPSLSNMSKGGRASFPWVMRITRWLKQPAAAFTRISPI